MIEKSHLDSAASGWGRRGSLISFFLVLPLWIGLGARGFNEPDEGRFLEISREFIATGDWIVPRLNGVPHFAKPPLVYWATAGSLLLFGFDEFAGRFVPAVAASIICLLLGAMVRRVAGVWAGWGAILCASSMVEFFLLGRTLTTDMLMSATFATAIHAYWSLDENRRADCTRGAFRLKLVFWLALAAGFMTKGPVPIALVALTIATHGFLVRDFSTVRRLGHAWGWPLFFVLALPWYVAVIKKDERLIDFFLVRELVRRSTDGLGREQPFYYTAIVLLIGALPWTLIALDSLARAMRRLLPGRRTMRADERLECLWLGATLLPLLMFSLAKSKLPTYVLPILAPLAGLAAMRVRNFMSGPDRLLPWLAGGTVALLIGGVAYVSYMIYDVDADEGKTVAFITATFVVVCGVGAVVAMRRLGSVARWVALFPFAGVVFHLHLAVAVPAIGRVDAILGHNSSYRSVIRALPPADYVGVEIDHRLRPTAGEQIRFPERGVRLISYELKFSAASFHAFGRRPEFLVTFGDGAGWEIEEDQELQEKTSPRRVPELIALLADGRATAILVRPRSVAELLRIFPGTLKIVGGIKNGRRGAVILGNAAYFAEVGRDFSMAGTDVAICDVRRGD